MSMSEIRLDTFIDPALVRKVSGIVRDMMKDKGFQSAEVTPEIVTMPGGPKLVHLTFHMSEGPKVKIKKIEFTGNKVFTTSQLKKKMKENREVWMFSFINGRGVFQETKFDADADKITEFYRENGYIRANVGVPEQKFISDSSDGKTRWIELRIPVTEGRRYKVGDVEFTGNTIIKTEYLKPLFKLNSGDFYNEKNVRKGMEKAREVYGGGGYWEFTGFPDYKFHDDPNPAEAQAPQALAAPVEPGPAIVDVTMRLQEGQQYFVNRITFVGNSTTHDTVIRRQMRLAEDGVFNTEALKSSIKLVNQLGYFKPLEGGKDVDVQKTPNETNKVDVRVKLEEQNRNQLTFGAGVSQYEGFFGQLSFQTSNFMGRGESLTVSLQAGSLAQNYTIGFTEPFLFDRNMTGGIQLFRQEIHYINQFTQRTDGHDGDVRLSAGQLHEVLRQLQLPARERQRAQHASTPIRRCCAATRSCRTRCSSARAASASSARSRRASCTTRWTTRFSRHRAGASPRRWNWPGWAATPTSTSRALEGVYFWKQNPRMSLGMRGQVEYIHQFTGSVPLPIFEKLFLGGEYSVRGFDIRSIGPSDPFTGLVLGGNKSLLFNIEQGVHDCRPGSRDSVLRRRPGAEHRRAVLVVGRHQDPGDPARRHPGRSQPAPRAHRSERAGAAVHDHRTAQRLQDVHGRRDPVLHARAQRAVPADLLRRSAALGRPRQQPAAAAGVWIPFRRRIDLLAEELHASIVRPCPCAWPWPPCRRRPRDGRLQQQPGPPDKPRSRACRSRTASRGRCRRTAPSRTRSRSPAWDPITAAIVGLAPNSAQIVGLQLGVWNGTSCTASSSTDVATTGSSITLTASSAGVVCVRLYDVGFIDDPGSLPASGRAPVIWGKIETSVHERTETQ